MSTENQVVIKELNELEIKYVTGNLKNCKYIFHTDENIEHYATVRTVLHCIAENIVNHDYEKILRMKVSDFGISLVTSHRGDNVQISIENKFSDDELYSCMLHTIILFIGSSALQEFVRYNMCGPSPLKDEEYHINSELFANANFSRSEILHFLSKDGEYVYSNVLHPELLYLSLVYLSSISDSKCLTVKWWLLRCTLVHQYVLPERNVVLRNMLTTYIKEISEMEWLNCNANIAKLIFYVESAQIHLYYHEVVIAKKLINEARMFIGLDIELSGAFGKRTQFQEKAIPQLLVKLKRNQEKRESDVISDCDFYCPFDVHLQDDTLLNQIAFIDNDENIVDDLLAEEQIVLLGYCLLAKRSGSFDELLREEIMAYINCLLAQPKVWSIYLKVLIMRCSAEKNESRRIERAIMQMGTIVDSIRKDLPPFSVRQCMLYATSFPMYWVMEKELADLFLSTGATNSALEIYERLQLWEDIVVCYQRLGRTMCAEKIIREQLAKKETPMLWCLLGDVTDNPEYYSKAWELSEHRSARSQRSLAYYYFKRKDYEESVPYFLSSLQINHLQPNVWFSVGYAATQLEKYELAAQAYRQVVTLDQDNFEAWNNLSNAYIKTKQKVRAWRSLQEALKCNYEEWRVWENFLLVSIDVGAFEDVLRAWHRLLDIKGKHQDSEVLEILVNAIKKDLPDINGFPASRLKKRSLQLFGRLTSIITTDYKIWELYSLLHCTDESFINEKDTLERIVQFQQKAFRCCTQKGQWEKEFLMCKEVLRITLRLAEVSVLYVKLLEGSFKNQQKTSVKLALQNVICRIEKSIDDFQDAHKEELNLLLISMKNYLSDIQTL